MGELIIRQAMTEEAESIADFSRKTFFDTFAQYNTEEDMRIFMDEQFSREKLTAQVKNNEGIFLVALLNNQLVGYARLIDRTDQFLPKTSIEISRIYASKEVIGKGIGKALMQACLDLAHSLHRQLIWLGVWEKNERAIRFYQNWGFQKAGEHEFILGKDIQTDWIMVKELTNQS